MGEDLKFGVVAATQRRKWHEGLCGCLNDRSEHDVRIDVTVSMHRLHPLPLGTRHSRMYPTDYSLQSNRETHT
jgi:hypothetical protein